MSTDHNVREQLKALIRLQNIDSRIDRIEQLRGDLPDHIQDLEDEKAGLTTRIEKYRQEKAQGEVDHRRATLAIEEAEAAIKRYEEQQLQVRNNREYDALTKEIEAQRHRITEMQTMMEELGERDSTNEVSMQESESRLSELEIQIESKREELRRVVEDTQHEQATLLDHKARAAEEVDPRYLNAYDRLRRRLRDGRAVVPLERGAAGGFAVPPQRQVEIRQQNRIVVCEHTGRIIVDKDLFEETVKELPDA